jgi:hypothetical protein
VNAIVLILYDLLRQNWALILVVSLLVGAWLFLRTPADPVSLDGFRQEIRSGRPVVVEFFSNT